MQITQVIIDVLFILIVFSTHGALTYGLYRAQRSLGKKAAPAMTDTLWIGGWILAWLGATGTLAYFGVFNDFESVPPKIALVILPSMIATIILGTMKKTGQILKGVSFRSVVALQGFRVGVEIVLFLLIMNHELPELMSITGRNYDLFVGLVALVLACFAFKKGKLRSKGWQTSLFVWNTCGVLILTVTVIHGLLAAPTAFRVFHTVPSTAIIGTFPYIWLPTFLVPVGFFLHILAFRFIARGKK